MRPMVRRVVASLSVLLAAALTATVVANVYVVSAVRTNIVAQVAAVPEDFDAQAILILGAGVKKNGQPSDALRDRLQTGLELWEQGRAGTVVVTGANSVRARHQVDVMAAWLEERGVRKGAIIRDPGGVNTYDSMWRAHHTYGFSRVIAVSQRFHLARIVYDGARQGIDVVGVPADRSSYSSLWAWTAREWLARTKDVVLGWIQPRAGSIDF